MNTQHTHITVKVAQKHLDYLTHLADTQAITVDEALESVLDRVLAVDNDGDYRTDDEILADIREGFRQAIRGNPDDLMTMDEFYAFLDDTSS